MKYHSVLEVDLVHVREYNQELGDALENRPAEFLPLVRWACTATDRIEQHTHSCSLCKSRCQKCWRCLKALATHDASV